MPTIRAGKWLLIVIPGDHNPRHVHACLGSKNGPQVIAFLAEDGIVSVREIKGSVSNADARKALAAVQEHFDDLLDLWKRFCR